MPYPSTPYEKTMFYRSLRNHNIVITTKLEKEIFTKICSRFLELQAIHKCRGENRNALMVLCLAEKFGNVRKLCNKFHVAHKNITLCARNYPEATFAIDDKLVYYGHKIKIP